MAFSRAMWMLSVLVMAGCHSNLYSTPRTVPRGQSQHVVAADLNLLPTDSAALPTLVYLARIGLADRVDLGIQASTTLKVDLKVNPVRTRYFDLAFDPALSFGYVLAYGIAAPIFSGSLPVVMGFNVHESVTLVLQGGAGYAYPYTRSRGPVYGFGGGGLQLRVNELVMVQPEITLQFFDNGDVWPCLGLGFGFGPQPSYKTPPPPALNQPSLK